MFSLTRSQLFLRENWLLLLRNYFDNRIPGSKFLLPTFSIGSKWNFQVANLPLATVNFEPCRRLLGCETVPLKYQSKRKPQVWHSISVYIGQSPREREKEEGNDRWKKTCSNNPSCTYCKRSRPLPSKLDSYPAPLPNSTAAFYIFYVRYEKNSFEQIMFAKCTIRLQNFVWKLQSRFFFIQKPMFENHCHGFMAF